MSEVTAEERADCDVWTHLSRDTIEWMVRHMSDPGLSRQVRDEIERIVVVAQEYAAPEMAKYVNMARDEHSSEGSVEIDSSAAVSRGNDDGAYVMAWVWVYDDEPDETDAGEEDE